MFVKTKQKYMNLHGIFEALRPEQKSNYELRQIDLYERGTVNTIKRESRYAKRLQKVVDTFLKMQGARKWSDLTADQAMELNLLVKAKLAELKPNAPELSAEQKSESIGAYVNRERSLGRSNYLD